MKDPTFNLRWLRAAFVFLPLAALLMVPVRGQPLRAEEFRLLPVRVHLLRSAIAPELDCSLTPRDALRILGKVNGIWKAAAIQFYADCILQETAANEALYHGLGANRSLPHLRLVRPRPSAGDRAFHVYYIHAMRPNGVTLDGSYELIFVKDSARLTPVPGGIDEPLPRVTAHEIGHALGLDHRQDGVNLMASGTTGTSLNEAEISTARKTAEALSWSLTPAAALALAERRTAAKDADGAGRIYHVLAGLPEGDVARAARQRL